MNITTFNFICKNLIVPRIIELKKILGTKSSSISPEDVELYPFLIRGDTGIGKSAVIRQFTDTLSNETGVDYVCVDRRISQMTEGDMLGLPHIDMKDELSVTNYAPNSWFHIACTRPTVLFLDELDRGSDEVAQAVFELGDSRKIGGNYLHPLTVVFSAVNGREGNHNYQTNAFDPAALDRWTVFDLSPTAQEWVEWARESGVNSLVTQFIESNISGDNCKFLENTPGSAFVSNKVYPTRRAWTRAARMVLNRFNPEKESDRPYILTAMSGFVGYEAAAAFDAFLEKQEFSLSVEDVIIHGKQLPMGAPSEERLAWWSSFKESEFWKCLDNANNIWYKDKTDVSRVQNLSNFMENSAHPHRILFYRSIVLECATPSKFEKRAIDNFLRVLHPMFADAFYEVFVQEGDEDVANKVIEDAKELEKAIQENLEGGDEK